jgi:hypothetical protein
MVKDEPNEIEITPEKAAAISSHNWSEKIGEKVLTNLQNIVKSLNVFFLSNSCLIDFKLSYVSILKYSLYVGWPCKRCDRDMKGLSKYVTHLEDFHPDDNAIFCPFCEKLGFPARKELRRHVILDHKVWIIRRD